jgi:hypothetical protein
MDLPGGGGGGHLEIQAYTSATEVGRSDDEHGVLVCCRDFQRG